MKTTARDGTFKVYTEEFDYQQKLRRITENPRSLYNRLIWTLVQPRLTGYKTEFTREEIETAHYFDIFSLNHNCTKEDVNQVYRSLMSSIHMRASKLLKMEQLDISELERRQ